MVFKKAHPFIRGTLILTLTGLFSRLIGFFYRIYLSNLFGEEGMGIYQLLGPVLALTFSLCAAAIQTSISKYIAAEIGKGQKRAAYRYLFTGLFFSIGLSLICMEILLVFSEKIAVGFLHESRCASMIRILAYSVPLSSVHSCINGFYYGIKKTGIPSATQLIEQFCRILCVLFASLLAEKAGSAPTINVAVLGLVIGEGVATLVSVFAIYRHACLDKSAKEGRIPGIGTVCCHLLSLAVPLSLSRIVINFLQSIEAVMIPLKLQDHGYDVKTALCVYGVLTGMALPLIFFPNALTGSMSVLLLPMVSEADSTGDNRKVKKTAVKTILLCLMLGLVCTASFYLLGPFFGKYLFKSELAGIYIRSLGPICPFLYLSTMLSSILHGLGKAIPVFAISVVSLTLRLGFVYFLVPLFGIDSYIFATILSQVTSALLLMCLLKKHW